MPRITITTDDGEVVEIIKAEDMGDLSKPMPRADLTETVVRAVNRAQEKEQRMGDSWDEQIKKG